MNVISRDSPAPRHAALFRRRGAPGGPLVLYLFLAVCVLWPYRSSQFRDAGDLGGILAGIVEAKNALREGQFPIRVAPRQLDGVRYPIFQYYANFPYTVTGALGVIGVNPYLAWKLAMLAALTTGGAFVYLSAYRLTRRVPAAMAGGVVFVVAPYVFTDLNARGAFAELVALNLLPVAFYATHRCFASPRLRYVLACAVAWTCVGMSHNITYLYGVVFLGLLFASMLGRRRRSLGRLARLASAGGLHAMLMSWYVVPQLSSLPLIEMYGQSFSPYEAAWLGSLDVLLASGPRSPAGSTTPNLGLQVGWAVLAGAGLATLGLLYPGRSRRRIKPITLRLLVLFAAAFFAAWSPVDFWKHLPKTFWFIQFPYRMLVFTTFIGSLLVTCGITLCFGRKFRAMPALVSVALAASASAAYVPSAGRLFRHYVREAMANPSMGGLYDYLLTGAAAAETAYVRSDIDLSLPQYALTRGDIRRVFEKARTALNVPPGATQLRLRGTVPQTFPPAEVLELELDGRWRRLPLEPGEAEFAIKLPDSLGDRPSFALTPRDAKGNMADLRLTCARYEGAAPEAVRLVPAEESRRLVRYGRRTKCRFESTDRVLLQLPVLYYPGLVRVEDYGVSLAVGNLGRFIAVELPPGKHRLEVRYVGARWANVVSAAGWIIVVGGVVLVARGRRRWRREPNAGPRFSLPLALLACAGAAVGGAVAFAVPQIRQQFGGDDKLHLVPSRVADPEHLAPHAFDGRSDTAWMVNGPEPATLSIETSRPRLIRGLRLHARKTSLRETWHTVHLSAFLNNWLAHDHVHALPDASRNDAEDLIFPRPLKIDRMLLTFTDPVVETLAGGRVGADAVNPGYTEIEILWADR